MTKVLLSQSVEAKSAITALSDNAPPVLVEVRFPQQGTSPDWHLCEKESQFEQLLERLGPGIELHVSSVWNLRSIKGPICLKKETGAFQSAG